MLFHLSPSDLAYYNTSEGKFTVAPAAARLVGHRRLSSTTARAPRRAVSGAALRISPVPFGDLPIDIDDRINQS